MKLCMYIVHCKCYRGSNNMDKQKYCLPITKDRCDQSLQYHQSKSYSCTQQHTHTDCINNIQYYIVKHQCLLH